jgi:hypothetical protein
MWTFFLLLWFSFQAILVLVHDLGPNWELVSDVLSYNSQLKVILMSVVHSCYWKRFPYLLSVVGLFKMRLLQ